MTVEELERQMMAQQDQQQQIRHLQQVQHQRQQQQQQQHQQQVSLVIERGSKLVKIEHTVVCILVGTKSFSGL